MELELFAQPTPPEPKEPPIRTLFNIFATALAVFGFGVEMEGSHPYLGIGLMLVALAYGVWELFTSDAAVSRFSLPFRLLFLFALTAILIWVSWPYFWPNSYRGRAGQGTENAPQRSLRQESSPTLPPSESATSPPLPKSVLTMWANMSGVFSPSVKFSQVNLRITNPKDDGINNLDVNIGMKSKHMINSISEVAGEDSCELHPINLFPTDVLQFNGADRSHIAIDTREQTQEFTSTFGSEQWKLFCSRLSGHISIDLEMRVEHDAENDLIIQTGAYELPGSMGSRKVNVNSSTKIWH